MSNKISPRIVLGAMLTAALLLMCWQGCKGKSSIPKKSIGEANILLITLDTTRADYIGAYGHSSIKTPNIDKLCRQGVMFKNCISPVPLTLPAHCSLLTGKYPVGHQVRNNARYFLKEEEQVLSELLRQKGYFNFAAVASFVLMAKFGLSQGFNIYDDSLEPGKMYSSFESEITADAVYKKFNQWFANYPAKTKKFFAWIHFYDPHQPYLPPAAYLDKTDPDNSYKRYAGEIEFVDEYTGRIISDLQAAGVLENTLVIIAGDHGEAFGEHQEKGHSIFCYEENVKVPLVFYNEKIFAPHVVNQPVTLVDVMPTVLELLDIEIPRSTQGKSLLYLMDSKHPVKDKEETENARAFLLESMYGQEEMGWAPLTAIIAGKYKYIALPEPELYDLESDSLEKENLYRKQFNISKDYDKKLKELILQVSSPVSAAGDTSKRDLSNTDLQHLKSLGYISADSTAGKSSKVLDPKQGVLIDNKLKTLSVQIKKNENLGQVETELKKIITETPELINPIVYNLLARLYRKQKDESSLLKVMQQCIAAFPDYVQNRSNYARHLFNSKKFDEVIEQCRKIIELNPTFTQAYIMLGDVYYQQGKIEETLKNYAAAVRLEHENVKLKKKYADLLLKSKNLSAALDVYNTLVDKEAEAGDHEFLYQVALLNSQLNKHLEAESIFRRIIQIKPNGKYHFYFARILWKNQKYQEAAQHMEIALQQYRGELTPQQQEQALKITTALEQNQ